MAVATCNSLVSEFRQWYCAAGLGIIVLIMPIAALPCLFTLRPGSAFRRGHAAAWQPPKVPCVLLRCCGCGATPIQLTPRQQQQLANIQTMGQGLLCLGRLHILECSIA